MNRRHFLLAGSGLVATTAPAMAQFFPKTLIDRAIEARSMGDIAKDNEVVLKVNKVMADSKTASASTEIYEQRLLITGMIDDKATYDRFEKGVKAVPEVKKLYWHVTMMTKEEQEKRKAELAGWADVLALATKGHGRLVGTAGVADVNFRVCGDAFRTLYIIGRARSKEEADKAIARLKEGDGVKKVVSYIDVRA
jgi:osmotically-inducible protein OsmY